MKMGVPRRLLQPDRTDLNDKEREIEILKEQLKHKEEQLRQSEELTKAQKYVTISIEHSLYATKHILFHELLIVELLSPKGIILNCSIFSILLSVIGYHSHVLTHLRILF